MIGYCCRRLATSVVVLLALVVVVFVLHQQSGIDAIRAKYDNRVSAEVVAEQRALLGLDDPLPVQFVRYIGDVVRGDFGTSLVTNRSVRDDLADMLPATLELAAAGLLLAGIGGLVLGLGMARPWKGQAAVRGFLLTVGSVPSFLLGVLCLLVLYRWLQLLPAGGRITRGAGPPERTGLMVLDSLLAGQLDTAWDAARHLLAPALCIAAGPAVAIGRTLGSELESFLSSDHARTARSKGQSDGEVILRHGLRNVTGPVLAIVGLQVVYVLGGAVVVEQIFSWPGTGQYLVRAISNSDLNAVAAVTLVLALIFVIVTSILDLLSAWADPRTRLR